MLRSLRFGVLACLACFLNSPDLSAELARHDGPGNLRSMNIAGRFVTVGSEISMPASGWQTIATTNRWSVSSAGYDESGGQRRWRGQAASGGVSFGYLQTEREVGDRIEIGLEITSQTNAALEGVFFFTYVLVSDFAGGVASIHSGPSQTGSTPLPVDRPDNIRMLYANGDRALIADATGNLALEIGVSRVMLAAVQDEREWARPYYATYFRLHQGSLASGQTVSATFTFRLTGQPDAAPALLAVDASDSSRVFDGWGGNFVFGADSPEAQYQLSNLRVAWARTQASLRTWEPSNDNADPNQTDWAALGTKVIPGSELHREFTFARQIEDLGIPRIASTWWLPRWLLPQDGANLPRAMGDELAECVVSYLVYGKQHFGVEPDYYSFNEPDYGVYLRETADEHRDLIKLLGERFQAAGLKTKLLLADVASVTTPASYAQPTVDDAAAYSRVGALSVHSWAGDDYTDWITGMRNWSQFASNFGLPFLVTEVGADASAWHFPWLLNEFAYAMDDLRNYLMVLRHGQPRSGLLWELTNDYGTVYSSGGQILPTKRFWMVKHLADFSPPGGSYLDLETECADLLGVGFAKRARNHSTITLHIGNFGPAREATIVGLSSRLEQLAVLRTSESESLQGVGMVRVERGAALLQLGPQSLTTLVGRAREPGRRW